MFKRPRRQNKETEKRTRENKQKTKYKQADFIPNTPEIILNINV